MVRFYIDPFTSMEQPPGRQRLSVTPIIAKGRRHDEVVCKLRLPAAMFAKQTRYENANGVRSWVQNPPGGYKPAA